MIFQDTIYRKMAFWVPGRPQAVQSTKFARIGNFTRAYQPTKVVNWKSYVASCVAAQMREMTDCNPFVEGPIFLGLGFNYIPPKSLSAKEKRIINENGIVWKTTKPDVSDNLPKGICDALNGILWKDDSIIAQCLSMKFYSEHEGVKIVVANRPFVEGYISTTRELMG